MINKKRGAASEQLQIKSKRMEELIKEAEYLGLMEASYERKEASFQTICRIQAAYNVKQAKFLKQFDKKNRTDILNKLQTAFNKGYNDG